MMDEEHSFRCILDDLVDDWLIREGVQENDFGRLGLRGRKKLAPVAAGKGKTTSDRFELEIVCWMIPLRWNVTQVIFSDVLPPSFGDQLLDHHSFRCRLPRLHQV
ncbi:hypothetical protein Tco_0004335 [Tanacetum coccineum]